MNNKETAKKSTGIYASTLAKASSAKPSYAAAVKGILKNPKNFTLARPAPRDTDQGKAEIRATNVSKVLLRKDSIREESNDVQDMFGLYKDHPTISNTNVTTLKGIPPVTYQDSIYRNPSKLRFNELVTVLFIDPEGLSLRTPSLYPTEQETKARLEELAKDVAYCLVRDVTTKADLVNIRTILKEMINENRNNVNRSLKVSQRIGTDKCTVQFTRHNIKTLNDYYYIYKPDEDIKMSYLDYAVTLAIEQFTQKYNRVTERMKRSLSALYSSIMEYVGGILEGGNRRSRKGKKTSKKSKKRKLSKRRSSKRRTLKKR
jgi:hypothetical protein